MKRVVSTILLVLINFHYGNLSFPKKYGKISTKAVTGDFGEPLLLTPLIEQNRIKEAQAAARVSLEEFNQVKSYAAFLTVDKIYNSNMFFWFFPAKKNYKSAPVLLWLQGGPGASSLYGLFSENGPFILKGADKVRHREYTWTHDHSVIYIDNPVGTGFSFTDGGYAQNETKVGEDLYEALKQFFTLFPELQKNDFFVTGESYAGKYLPAIAYTILKKNGNDNVKINLQGLAIGNGLSDPENQLQYGQYLYEIGLIDTHDRQIFSNLEQQGIKYIQNEQYDKAFNVFDILINGDLTKQTTAFKNATGFDNYFNYLQPKGSPNDDIYLGQFLQRGEVRKAIHTGNLTYNNGELVEQNLINDVMKPITPWVSEILSKYRVLIYNGQLDIIVAYPNTVKYLQKLKFSGASKYKTAKRTKWYVGDDLAGYAKTAGNLTEVIVRNSGHMVPVDQPKWALDLITKFTRNISLS
nr:venom serine carboxypeptidase-like [Leptinotarsa decemlineata]